MNFLLEIFKYFKFYIVMDIIRCTLNYSSDSTIVRFSSFGSEKERAIECPFDGTTRVKYRIHFLTKDVWDTSIVSDVRNVLVCSFRLISSQIEKQEHRPSIE